MTPAGSIICLYYGSHNNVITEEIIDHSFADFILVAMRMESADFIRYLRDAFEEGTFLTSNEYIGGIR